MARMTMTLYQEGSVQIAAKAAFTLASGSTLIMSGDPRKMDTRYLDLSVNGTLVVQPGAALQVGAARSEYMGQGPRSRCRARRPTLSS